MKYGELTLGHVEAVVNKLGGMEGVQKFLSGELTVSESESPWYINNGVIHFAVTSDGTTGEEWIKRLRDQGVFVNLDTESILLSPDFKPTNGVTTVVEALEGSFFSEEERNTTEIRAEAQRQGWQQPNAEVACLMCERLTPEDMKAIDLAWIIVMHEPIKSSDGTLNLLSMGRSNLIHAYSGDYSFIWRKKCGFAFAVPQE
ncbi:hypothetical protein COB18_03970 [Candidatus Kaiserbacteria bacterium]|nr:MAG: hypothetical protein COB18_03970 [Candidatus Kaiserbacteria bacterium]